MGVVLTTMPAADITPDGVLLLAHAAATVAMAGLIWFVQVVHYPLFGAVGAERFGAYESAHRRLTTRVVAPLMLAELATAAALPFRAGVARPEWVPWAGLALLGVVWASTWFVQVPLHETLSAGFDAGAHRRLVRSNWVRTAAWTARAALALWLVGASR